MRKLVLLTILSLSCLLTFGQLSHPSGYFTMYPYNSSYDDGSHARIFYDGNNKRIQFWNSDGATQYTSLYTGSIQSNGTIKGSLNHSFGYLYIHPYSSSYDDGTETRLYYDGNNKKILFINSDPNTAFSNIQVGSVHSDGNIGIGTNSPNAAVHAPGGTALIGGAQSLSLSHLNNTLGVISKDDNASTYSFYVGQPSGADLFWVRGNGNGFFKNQLGIGTTTPNASLHVPNGTALVGGTNTLSLTHLNNSLGVISKDDNASTYPFYVGQPSGADLFWVRGNGNGYIKGQVGIGTTTTGSHKLAVEGSIGAREIKVEATGWSDFVFAKDYKLPSLKEVEDHITKKGHLPEIPSEAEVVENGINLGEMDAKLLQKIEELTLYLIEQNKKIEQLEKEISEMKGE